MPFPYVPQEWEDFPSQVTPIDAARLEHMETGIVAAAPQTTPASEDYFFGEALPWDSGSDYDFQDSLCSNDGLVWICRQGTLNVVAPTAANLGDAGTWLPFDLHAAMGQAFEGTFQALLAGSNLMSVLGGTQNPTTHWYENAFDSTADYARGDIVWSPFNLRFWVANTAITGPSLYPGPPQDAPGWDAYTSPAFLDDLLDASAPSNTPAGKVLGTTATGVWGPVEFIQRGAGTPEGAVTAAVGSMYLRSDGGTGTTLYIKESGAGNTGWVAK